MIFTPVRTYFLSSMFVPPICMKVNTNQSIQANFNSVNSCFIVYKLNGLLLLSKSILSTIILEWRTYNPIEIKPCKRIRHIRMQSSDLNYIKM